MAHQTNSVSVSGAAFFFKLALVLSLVLMMSMPAHTKLIAVRLGKHAKDAEVVCSSVHETESGETCSGVAQDFGLSLDDFLTINPNINCNSIFVGQWLCVDGSAP